MIIFLFVHSHSFVFSVVSLSLSLFHSLAHVVSSVHCYFLCEYLLFPFFYIVSKNYSISYKTWVVFAVHSFIPKGFSYCACWSFIRDEIGCFFVLYRSVTFREQNNLFSFSFLFFLGNPNNIQIHTHTQSVFSKSNSIIFIVCALSLFELKMYEYKKCILSVTLEILSTWNMFTAFLSLFLLPELLLLLSLVSCFFVLQYLQVHTYNFPSLFHKFFVTS